VIRPRPATQRLGPAASKESDPRSYRHHIFHNRGMRKPNPRCVELSNGVCRQITALTILSDFRSFPGAAPRLHQKLNQIDGLGVIVLDFRSAARWMES